MSGNKIITQVAIHATIFTILLVAPIVVSDQIPYEKGGLNNWFSSNIQHFSNRKGIINATLAAAESNVKIIKVRKDGSGDFSRVTAAIDSIPAGNTHRIILWIGGGTYNEKIRIARTKPFVTFYGSPNAMPTLVYSGTAAQFGTVDSATVVVEAEYFMAANIIFKNSAPRPSGKKQGEQAVALRISGDKAAFYNCRMLGFQDTLCDDKGRHFYKDCYIEGTVDFIFGSGKSIYLNTEIYVLGDSMYSFITAQAREYESEDTGYSFVHCKIGGTGNGTYLGRAWRARPKVVFSYTSMTGVIRPVGWSINFYNDRAKTVFYGEYMCTGPGANPKARQYSKQLTKAQAQPFLSLTFIDAAKWLLQPPKL